MRKNILAPSILAADFCQLGNQIQMTEENGAKYLHFDVMDGKFVPSISFGVSVLASIKKVSTQVMDVHLMIENPIQHIEAFVNAGADSITVHVEACEDIQETIDKIKQYNMKCGLSVKPGTSVEVLTPYLSQIDMVLMMSVEPGFGGQAFIPASLERITKVKDMIDQAGLDVDIEVDGGIYLSNVEAVLDAGANIIVSGSAVFGGEIAENTKAFMEILNAHE